jgi:hypothetical protein
MAHFAEINDSNVVTRVIVVGNSDTADAQGNEKEYIGAAFCERLFGGTWKQTSYNSNFRVRYAGVGYEWHADLNSSGTPSGAFVAPKPFPSWVLDSSSATYKAPNPPGDAPALTDDQIAAGNTYTWSETNYNNDPTTAWVLV